MSEEPRPRMMGRGLGRGLSALLGDGASEEAAKNLRHVATELLQPGRFQPRRHFDQESLDALADSVRAQGILQPILVRRSPENPNHYEILAGERRWRAAQAARLHEVPVLVRELGDREASEIALVENVQRQDLNPSEEAQGYHRLIDDLVTRGTEEPYRMFTSRAEYRLVLRADNADQRLTPLGVDIGCVSSRRETAFGVKSAALAAARVLLCSLKLTPSQLRAKGIGVNADGIARSAADLLRYPDVDLHRLAAVWPELNEVESDIAEQLEIDGRYAGYLERQEADIRAFRRDEALALPRDLDYAAIGSLSTEIRQKLNATKPESLGAAARVSGVTPAALIALLRYVKRGEEAA